MSADWVERASQLIEQSRKTAASVVLALGIAAAIALYGRDNWPAFTQLAGSLQTTLAVLLFLGCYSVAVLIVGVTVDIFQGIRNWAARKRVREAQARSNELEWGESERQLRALLPELTTMHFDVLGEFKQKQPGNLPCAVFGRGPQDFLQGDLARLGFIAEIAKVGFNRSLFELTPAAARIVPTFVADYRRKVITAALERAGYPEKTLLQLFAEPEPPPGEPRHERMRRDVYSAIRPLVTSFVLTHEGMSRFPGVKPEGPLTETISLTAEARSLVEEIILHHEVVRTAAVLDLSNIEGNGASGSGPLRPILPH